METIFEITVLCPILTSFQSASSRCCIFQFKVCQWKWSPIYFPFLIGGPKNTGRNFAYVNHNNTGKGSLRLCDFYGYQFTTWKPSHLNIFLHLNSLVGRDLHECLYVISPIGVWWNFRDFTYCSFRRFTYWHALRNTRPLAKKFIMRVWKIISPWSYFCISAWAPILVFREMKSKSTGPL